jgi:hypothetical protein
MLAGPDPIQTIPISCPRVAIITTLCHPLSSLPRRGRMKHGRSWSDTAGISRSGFAHCPSNGSVCEIPRRKMRWWSPQRRFPSIGVIPILLATSGIALLASLCEGGRARMAGTVGLTALPARGQAGMHTLLRRPPEVLESLPRCLGMRQRGQQTTLHAESGSSADRGLRFASQLTWPHRPSHERGSPG